MSTIPRAERKSTPQGTGALSFHVINTGDDIAVPIENAFVAGYTGRDPEAVQAHISELQKIGVAPPPEVPMYYRMAPSLFSTADAFESKTSHVTSGEVEPLYVLIGDEFYVGVGSDHTDRELETVDIAESKLTCPKPVGTDLVSMGDVNQVSLDSCQVRCWVDDVLYQSGTLNEILSPADALGPLREKFPTVHTLICLGGTVPLLNGKFQRGTRWKLSLEFEDGRSISHSYSMK
ncbi:DUF2848 family protein [Propionibacterium sp.]|uniref:DUF2848 family protein n=1 Tax=Propionibacterium sp. TaxID=1977903 RepID=UPI0039E848BC